MLKEVFIKEIYSLVMRCMVVLGALAVEKIVGIFLYWSLFPLVLSACGKFWIAGMAGLFFLQVFASLLFLKLYDIAGNDLLQVSTASGIASNAWIRLRDRFSGGEPLVPERVARTIKFLFLSWQFLPPLVVLIERKGGRKIPCGVEPMMIFVSSGFATVWWSLYSMVIIELWQKLFG